MAAGLVKNIASLRGGASASAGAPPPASSQFDWAARFDAASDKEGKLVGITIIEAGPSLNGPNYLASTLKEAAHLFVGVGLYSFKFGRSPGDEAKERHLPDAAEEADSSGLVGNLVGKIVEATWSEEAQAIKGKAEVIDEATRTKLLNAFEAGAIGEGVEEPLIALSIRADGEKLPNNDVIKITKVRRLDMVRKAAAGGSVDALLEAHEEGDMADLKIEDITKAVGEVVDAKLAKLKEENDAAPPAGAAAPPAPAAGGADALAALRKLIEGADGDAKRTIATKVLAMLKEMGVLQASASEDRFSRMSAGLKSLTEGDDAPTNQEEWNAAIAKLVESVIEKPVDVKQQRIDELENWRKENAIKTELASIAESAPELSFHCIDTAVDLADLSGVAVAEDYSKVTGLKESLEKLAKDKPWMVKPVEDGDGVEGVEGETDEQKAARLKAGVEDGAGSGKGKGKPAPRGQSVKLLEGHDPKGNRKVQAIESRLAEILPFARKGDDRAIAEMGKLNGERLKALAGG